MAVFCATWSVGVISGLHALQMEVGIEDCLHIEFEYDKGRYHLKDTVVGKIYFLLVCIRPQATPPHISAVYLHSYGPSHL